MKTKSTILAMSIIVERGKRNFTFSSRRYLQHGYRRVTISERDRIAVYHVPLSQCRIFWSGMVHRLIDRHLAGELQPYREAQAS